MQPEAIFSMPAILYQQCLQKSTSPGEAMRDEITSGLLDLAMQRASPLPSDAYMRDAVFFQVTNSRPGARILVRTAGGDKHRKCFCNVRRCTIVALNPNKREVLLVNDRSHLDDTLDLRGMLSDTDFLGANLFRWTVLNHDNTYDILRKCRNPDSQ